MRYSIYNSQVLTNLISSMSVFLTFSLHFLNFRYLFSFLVLYEYKPDNRWCKYGCLHTQLQCCLSDQRYYILLVNLRVNCLLQPLCRSLMPWVVIAFFFFVCFSQINRQFIRQGICFLWSYRPLLENLFNNQLRAFFIVLKTNI